LPITLVAEEDFTLVHGSPREPLWEYLLELPALQQNFPYLKTKYCLNGHTHLPAIYEEAEKADVVCEGLGPEIDLDGIKDTDTIFQLAERRLMINPGSIAGGSSPFNWGFSFYIVLDVDRKYFEYRQLPLEFDVFRQLRD
jgi:predicted phosphodiesterase